jgi:hypothetical protein
VLPAAVDANSRQRNQSQPGYSIEKERESDKLLELINQVPLPGNPGKNNALLIPSKP